MTTVISAVTMNACGKCVSVYASEKLLHCIGFGKFEPGPVGNLFGGVFSAITIEKYSGTRTVRDATASAR